MHVSMATSAGRSSQPNEDFVGAVPGAIVLLDGAGIPGTESICSHGVAWYTHRLGGALLGRLVAGRRARPCSDPRRRDQRDGRRPPRHLRRHPPQQPAGDRADRPCSRGRLDYLVLADSFLVLDEVGGGPEVITDEREVTTRRICTAPLVGVRRGRRSTSGSDSCIRRCGPAGTSRTVTGSPRTIRTRRRRRSPAAGPASTWMVLALLSNGASRIVSPYGLVDWPGALELLGAGGPTEIIRRVRQAEADTSDRPRCPGPRRRHGGALGLVNWTGCSDLATREGGDPGVGVSVLRRLALGPTTEIGCRRSGRSA